VTERIDLEPEQTGGGPLVQEPLWRIRLRLSRKAFARNWRIFVSNKIGLVGLGVIVVFAVMGLLHPLLMSTVWEPAIYDPVIGYDAPVREYVVVDEVQDPETEMDLATARLMSTPFIKVGEVVTIPEQPAAPSSAHLLGTDPLGRDVLSQLMYSTRAAFTMGAVAAIMSVVIATSVGSIAAYYGGWVDAVLMRFADLILLVPLIPVLIVVGALFNLTLLLLGALIGMLSGFGGTAIVLKSSALTVTVKPFVDAARVAGGSNRHIILKHIIPNVLPLSFLYIVPGPDERADELGDHDLHRPQPGLPAVGHVLLVVAVPGWPGGHPVGGSLLPGGPRYGRGDQSEAPSPLTRGSSQ